jgi:hypothetical protein
LSESVAKTLTGAGAGAGFDASGDASDSGSTPSAMFFVPRENKIADSIS